MFKQLDDSQALQAARAAEGAMLFLRDRTTRPDIGLSAAVLVVAVMCRALKVPREVANALLGHHWDMAHHTPAEPPAAPVRKPD